MALAQSSMVEQALKAAHPGLRTVILPIKTSGDWVPAQGETLLAESAGGKAQFAREIEEALLAGKADIGVHSSKDMDSHLPDGLVMDVFLPREDARDVLFVNEAARDEGRLWGLAMDAVVGTASARRAAFLRHRRPDLQAVPLRGNVQTRLDKLAAGQVQATLLAAAGLKRLGVEITGQFLEVSDMVPAAGQGAVGIEYAASNRALRDLLLAIHHPETGLRVAAERAAVKALGGTCRSPIGVHAVLEGGRMTLHGAVADEEGEAYRQTQVAKAVGDLVEAAELGRALAAELQG